MAEIPNDESSNDSDSKANTNTYNADLSYFYYKGKSLNINIYHKQTELEKRQLECDPDTDYNFLRIEVQVKKSKLNTLVSKFGLKGRELQYLVTPEIERYVLEYYVSKLTGKGIYVTYDRAMNIIDNSGYTHICPNECTKADNKEPERRQRFIRENIIQSCGYLICLRRPDGRLSKTWCTDNG